MFHQRGPTKLCTFQACPEEGLYLWHEEAGVYSIFSVDDLVGTKHIRADEFDFPRIALLNGKSRRIPEDDFESVAIDVTRRDKNGPQSSDNNENHPDNLDAMGFTYITGAPITFFETVDDSTSDNHGSDSTVGAKDSSEPSRQTRYTLQSRSDINYSCMAHIDNTDQPRLNVTLSNDERLQ